MKSVMFGSVGGKLNEKRRIRDFEESVAEKRINQMVTVTVTVTE